MANGNRPGWEDADYGAELRKVFDPEAAIERLLTELMTMVPKADGVMVGLVEADGRVRFVRTGGVLHGLAGATIDVETSLSGLAMGQQEVLVCDDASVDDRVDSVVLEQIEMASLAVVPLVRNGVAFGVVNMVAGQPHAFAEADLVVCTTLAEVLAGMVSLSAEAARLFNSLGARSGGLAAPHVDDDWDAARIGQFVAKVLSPAVAHQLDDRQRIAQILTGEGLDVVFQPVVELASLETVGFEALARFRGPPDRAPDWWFAQAHRVGLGVELELLALRRALEALPALRTRATLAVNLGPRALCTAEAAALIEASDPSRLIVELTEHAPVADYAALSAAVSRMRRAGVRLAVDDTGTGISSLNHIATLRPDLVKLDRWMVSGIDTDPIKQALVKGLLAVAEHLHAEVVAEGVEGAEVLQALRSLGVPLGQGYHFGRPAPLSCPSTASARTPR